MVPCCYLNANPDLCPCSRTNKIILFKAIVPRFKVTKQIDIVLNRHQYKHFNSFKDNFNPT